MERPLAARLAADVRRLALRPADLSIIRTDLDRLLRRRIGYDAAALSTTDPATLLLTSCFVTGLTYDRQRERSLFEGEYRGDDISPYTALAHAEVPVARLHAVTDGDLSRAKRFEPLLRPLDVRDEMRAVLRSRGGAWGTLTLYRAGSSPPFSADDERALAATTSAIADLFRLALLRSALRTPQLVDQPPGLLLIGRDGQLVASTPAAEQWLVAIDDRGRLPAAVGSVTAAVRGDDGLAQAVLPARDGRWVVLHGSAVKDEAGNADQISIIIEGARPVLLARLIADAYSLTEREAEVTSLLSLGLANKQIASRLGLSTYTVQDHVKAVFEKTGAQSRGQLVATLYGHYEPRNDAGLTPSPYGWYLDDEVRVPA
jgi:DNA-binding CsgD family transcriptional regulator